jgi:hypothetical protein
MRDQIIGENASNYIMSNSIICTLHQMFEAGTGGRVLNFNWKTSLEETTWQPIEG